MQNNKYGSNAHGVVFKGRGKLQVQGIMYGMAKSAPWATTQM